MESLAKKEPRFLVQAISFLAAGLTVTFTQLLHENLIFNEWIIFGFAIIFGLANVGSWVKDRKLTFLLLSGISSLLLAAVIFVGKSAADIKLFILIWAALNTILYGYSWLVTKSSKSITIAVLFGLLVLSVAFLANELPGVMGLFAAFCIMAGVYLGIAAFDPPEKRGVVA